MWHTQLQFSEWAINLERTKMTLCRCWFGDDWRGTDLGGGCRGCAPPPPTPLPEMKPSSSYLLLKFVNLTDQWRHSLEVHPLLRKILDPPLVKWFLNILKVLEKCEAIANHSKLSNLHLLQTYRRMNPLHEPITCKNRRSQFDGTLIGTLNSKQKNQASPV